MSTRDDRSRTAAPKSRAKDDTKVMERPSMQQWAPSSVLEVPQSDGEYRFRWIAEYVNGQAMSRNVSSALREGYERVTTTELPEDFIVDEDKGDGFARVGGLILMKLPEAFAKQREAHYLKRSAEAVHGANALQGIAGANAVHEDRGTRTLSGSEAGAALSRMSSQ